MLRITYAEHEQLIELSARPSATASLTQIAESLRLRPGVEGLRYPADPGGLPSALAGAREQAVRHVRRRVRCRRQA